MRRCIGTQEHSAGDKIFATVIKCMRDLEAESAVGFQLISCKGQVAAGHGLLGALLRELWFR